MHVLDYVLDNVSRLFRFNNYSSIIVDRGPWIGGLYGKQ